MAIFVAPLFFLTFLNLTAGQCFTEHNIPGMALKGYTFKRFLVKAPYVCDFKCDQDIRCQSFNYFIPENVCELNNRTKEEKPEHFVRDPERFYIKHLSTVSRKDYAFQFLNNETDDFVHVGSLPNLTQFTVCFWMQSDDTENRGSPISYALQGEDNALAIYDYNEFRFYLDGEHRPTSLSATDGKWHQICVSWENAVGSWKFYKDGDVKAQGGGLKTGHVIKSGGSLILGTEQDSLGGHFEAHESFKGMMTNVNVCERHVIKSGGSLILGTEQDSLGGHFEAHESFKGMMTNVNVWDHLLSAEKIASLSKSCLSGEGNVLKWSKDLINGLKGKTKVVTPSLCKLLNR